MVASGLAFLQDMAVVTIVAAAITVLFNRLRQPVVLGYILAGVVIGPFTPPFPLVQDIDTIEVLGELGVVFLLFALGLEFNLRKLRRVGFTAIVSGTLQAFFMIWIGYLVGRAFGFTPAESLFLGALISISSTVIIVKVLTEFGQQREEWAQIVFGILIVEDILAVIILTLLSASGGVGELSLASVGWMLAKLIVFMGGALVLGIVAIPRLVTYVARFPAQDVLIVTVIGLAFGLAILGARLGFSPALGAFIMGALIAESKVLHRVEERVAPVRDLFTAIFFVAVGMLVSPAALIEHWRLILAVAAAVIVGKVASASFATFVTGHDPRTALRVGFGLAQVGEFSFIIAGLALALYAIEAPLHEVAVSVAAITSFTTPLLVRAAPAAAAAFERLAPRPVLTFTSLYGQWVARLRELGAADPLRRRAWSAGARAALYGTAVIAIVAGGGAFVNAIGNVLVQAYLPEVAVALAGWAGVGLLALPFVLLFAHALRTAARGLAEIALPDRVRATASAANVRLVLTRTFYLTGIVLLSAVLLVFTAPVVPTLPVLAAVVAVVGGSGILLYASLVRFQNRIDEALSGVMSEGEGAQEDRKNLLALIREQYPWAVEVREIAVRSGAPAANRTLAGLHLRNRTGATIVAVHREGETILNPAPQTVLLPGDAVVVLGEVEQVTAAERLLVSPEGRVQASLAGVHEAVVSASSTLTNSTLASARLRERTGATVVAVLRGGRRIPNSPADERLREGDVLLVVGTPEQVSAVVALAMGDPASASAPP